MGQASVINFLTKRAFEYEKKEKEEGKQPAVKAKQAGRYQPFLQTNTSLPQANRMRGAGTSI